MVRYGTRRNRRYSRRRNSRLSTRRIFSRTSAKSQASQIATLRNRVNKVYKSCKPEIKTIYAPPETITYSSSSVSSYYRIYPLALPTLGTGDNNRTGNKIYVKNCAVYLSMEYFNTSPTGFHDSESAGAQYRVLIGQFRSPVASTIVPSIDSLFENPGGTGAAYTQMALSPLKVGVSAQYSIIKDIRGTITSDRNQKMLKINVHPKLSYLFDVDGKTHNMFCCLIVSGLHYDDNFKEYVKITISDKLVYTDA